MDCLTVSTFKQRRAAVWFAGHARFYIRPSSSTSSFKEDNDGSFVLSSSRDNKQKLFDSTLRHSVQDRRKKNARQASNSYRLSDN